MRYQVQGCRFEGYELIETYSREVVGTKTEIPAAVMRALEIGGDAAVTGTEEPVAGFETYEQFVKRMCKE